MSSEDTGNQEASEEVLPETASDEPGTDGSGNSNNNNDFVIRDGFPALRLPGGKEPWIDGDDTGVPSGLPRHAFWFDENAIEFDANMLLALREDCEIVFTAQPKDDDEAYSSGQTYFCPCKMQPRCALEALVLKIFQSHVQHLEKGVYLPEQSGAEWWTLFLEEDEVEKRKEKGKEEEDDDDGDEDDIGLHFDADYGLEDQVANLMLHPRLATVTYLSDCGAPTIVFEKRSPHQSDVEKKTLEGSIRKGWLSHPKIGKHIAFDGRFLHGAPSDYFPSNKEKAKTSNGEPPSKLPKLDRRRVTLLVNIWLNHCPMDAEVLDDEICEQLKTPWKVKELKSEEDSKHEKLNLPFVWKNQDTSKTLELEKASLKPNPAAPAGEQVIVLCNREVTVKYGAARADFHSSSSLASSVELDFEEGALVLEVGDEVKDESEDEE